MSKHRRRRRGQPHPGTRVRVATAGVISGCSPSRRKSRRNADGTTRQPGQPHRNDSCPIRAGPERLQKILSAAGIASRRMSEDLIQQGRVAVNGAVITQLGAKADPSRDDIRVDGRRIRLTRRRLYLLLNKPRGYVTTRRDPEGRPTVLDLLHGVSEYVYPVGRLDYDSEGLLLLTNDGELAARLTHPRHEVERVYRAKIRGVPGVHALERLQRGIVLDGRRTAPAQVAVKALPAAGTPHTIIEMTLHEGRQRQVRRMLEAVGHPVARLRRIRIGPIADETLPTGAFRELTREELQKLRRAAGL
jgi:23S rRNA pseudouridine2605 synthase